MLSQKSFDKLKKYIGGRSSSVIGFGVSNRPLSEMLFDLALPFTVHDKKPFDSLDSLASRLSSNGVPFVCGDNSFDNLSGDIIFRTPGVRPDIPAISDALCRGAELTSEVELFCRLSDSPIYAITGSDGKTTSTTLVGKFLEADRALAGEGQVFVGGNIGTPLLEYADSATVHDRTVLELSSFQLMTFPSDASPHFAAITNLSPNHLDWHLGMDEYLAAKTRIIGTRTCRLVTNYDCQVTRDLAISVFKEKKAKGEDFELILFSSICGSFADFSLPAELSSVTLVYHSDSMIKIKRGESTESLLDTRLIKVPGRHNVENFMTAIALTYGQVDSSVYSEVANNFTGVEHRLELCGVINGCDYYNSSIDSSPSRTAAALSALKGRDIVLMAGGYDKKIPYEPLADAIINCGVRAVVLTGATAEKIEKAIKSHPKYDEDALTVKSGSDFATAFSIAASLGRAGGCVVLSPASASFDAFIDFKDRGNRFKSLVAELSASLKDKN